MEVFKRKINRQRYLQIFDDVLRYSADTINIQIYLTQNIEDIGVYSNYFVDTITQEEIDESELDNTNTTIR